MTKENVDQPNPGRTQSRESGPSGLERVREAAKKDGKLQFTALLHPGNIDLLRDSYNSLKKTAAPGVDGVTGQEYGQDPEGQLKDRHGRIHLFALARRGISGATSTKSPDTKSRWQTTAILRFSAGNRSAGG